MKTTMKTDFPCLRLIASVTDFGSPIEWEMAEDMHTVVNILAEEHANEIECGSIISSFDRDNFYLTIGTDNPQVALELFGLDIALFQLFLLKDYGNQSLMFTASVNGNNTGYLLDMFKESLSDTYPDHYQDYCPDYHPDYLPNYCDQMAPVIESQMLH